MDFLREASSKFQGGEAGGETEHKKEEQQHTKSTSELLSSAKVVADATKAKMNNQEYDQGKASEAAADILDGAQHYGKLDETQGLGKMVEQAEDYLHKHSTTTKTTTADGTKPTTTHESSGGDTAGGYGKYVKMAEGLLDGGDGKKSEEGEKKEEEKSGGGGFMKMAGSFLK